jgi:PPK2 family polyphosphate:nucleotide phosphotransferase
MDLELKDYRVRPGEKVDLAEIDPRDTGEYDGGKDDGEELLDELNDRLEVLQERFYAAHKHSLLIILQGMDTCGKDGAIRHVFDGVNPQGVRVANFKVPTSLELDHDYLWRVHQKLPARGELVIFNRSHYEDVLVVRIHELVEKEVWQKRFDHINDFERMLADEGTTILKFYLHISKDEQKERLLARLDEPDKRWKFNPGDLKERDRWPEYQAAYAEAIARTSTIWAPWYVVPADRKWFRNLVVASVLVKTLERLDTEPPQPLEAQEVATYRAALAG